MMLQTYHTAEGTGSSSGATHQGAGNRARCTPQAAKVQGSVGYPKSEQWEPYGLARPLKGHITAGKKCKTLGSWRKLLSGIM